MSWLVQFWLQLEKCINNTLQITSFRLTKGTNLAMIVCVWGTHIRNTQGTVSKFLDMDLLTQQHRFKF